MGTSLNDLVGLLEQVLGIPITRNYRPGRPFDVPSSVLANGLAERELNWKPRVGLSEGLRRTAEWMRKDLPG